MDNNITIQLKEYFERILLTILHLQFSIRNPLKDGAVALRQMDTRYSDSVLRFIPYLVASKLIATAPNMIKILLNEDDNSLLKRQLKRISNADIEHIKQDENGFIYNFHSFFYAAHLNV